MMIEIELAIQIISTVIIVAAAFFTLRARVDKLEQRTRNIESVIQGFSALTTAIAAVKVDVSWIKREIDHRPEGG